MATPQGAEIVKKNVPVASTLLEQPYEAENGNIWTVSAFSGQHNYVFAWDPC